MTSTKKKPSGSSNDVLKYSGMAFEMMAFIAVGLFIGSRLDKWLHTSNPYFTLLLAVLFLTGYFVKLIRELSKKE